jgi:transglutaminase superfamily protein
MPEVYLIIGILGMLVLDTWGIIHLYRKSIRSLIVCNTDFADAIYPRQNRLILKPDRVTTDGETLKIGWDSNIGHPGDLYYKPNHGEWLPLDTKSIQLPLIGDESNFELMFSIKGLNRSISESLSLKKFYNNKDYFWQIMKWNRGENLIKRRFYFTNPGNTNQIIAKVKAMVPDVEQLNDFDKAIALMGVVKSVVDKLGPPANYDYLVDSTAYILDQLEKGDRGQCGTCAFLFVGLANAMGMIARPIGGYWYADFVDGLSPHQHVLSEVWLETHGKWVVMDSNQNVYFKENGNILSAIEIHDLYMNGHADRIDVCQNGVKISPKCLHGYCPPDGMQYDERGWAGYYACYTHLLYFKENFSWRLQNLVFLGPLFRRLNNPASFRKIPILNKVFPRYYHWFDANTPKISRMKYPSWYMVDVILIAHIVIGSIVMIKWSW